MSLALVHQYPRTPEQELIWAEERASRQALTRSERRAEDRRHRDEADAGRVFRHAEGPSQGQREAAERVFRRAVG